MLKILIAVDGSPHAHSAIETVAHMAEDGLAVEVHLLNVREMPRHNGEGPPPEIAEVRQRAAQQRLLADAKRRATRLGLRVQSLQSSAGSPPPEIVRTANELGVHQIVLGTHGHGSIGTLSLGSVARNVLGLSDVPVILVT